MTPQFSLTTNPDIERLLEFDFLRATGRTGSKIGCNEGDCGACTVLVGELSPNGQTVSYQSMTSCLTPLGNAAGKHIVTVKTEHKAVLDTCKALERKKLAQVTYLPVDQQGRVSADQVREAVVHATQSIQRRNVGPGYTNIAVLGTAVPAGTFLSATATRSC